MSPEQPLAAGSRHGQRALMEYYLSSIDLQNQPKDKQCIQHCHNGYQGPPGKENKRIEYGLITI